MPFFTIELLFQESRLPVEFVPVAWKKADASSNHTQSQRGLSLWKGLPGKETRTLRHIHGSAGSLYPVAVICCFFCNRRTLHRLPIRHTSFHPVVTRSPFFHRICRLSFLDCRSTRRGNLSLSAGHKMDRRRGYMGSIRSNLKRSCFVVSDLHSRQASSYATSYRSLKFPPPLFPVKAWPNNGRLLCPSGNPSTRIRGRH